VTVLK